ncbi:hypothetical protein LINPERHAP1_LOCUS26863 [Linum perenne]
MPLFAFKSNNHFVASSDGIVLHIYELTKSSVHLSSIQKVDWKKVATIDTDLRDDDDDDDIDPMGLLFFDGHGRIEGREALTMLAKHLRQLHLLVNPEGYCFQEVSEFGVYSDFGIHYVRLNDLFSWPRHKVDLATTNVWSRLELKYSLPKHKNTSQPPTVGGGVSKEKYAELEKSVKEKDDELEKLKMLKKKKDEEEMTKLQRIEELEKVNAQMKKELEECQKKSWAILPSTKFLPQNLDEKEKYLAMRQPVPPGTFSFRSQLSSCYVNNSHKLMDKMRVDHDYTIRLVDEESSPPEWPPLPMVTVQIGSENEDFDQNNWWYLKTTHPDGGLTMLVFYDGNRSQVSHDNHFSESDSIIPLPFSKGLEVYTYVHTFSIFRLHPFGVKFGFAYRPK